MSGELLVAVCALALEILLGVVFIWAEIVRLKTMLAPIARWYYEEHPDEVATLKVLEAERARRAL